MKQVSEPKCYKFSRTGFNLPSLFVIGLIGTAYYRWSKRGGSVYSNKNNTKTMTGRRSAKNHCHPSHPCPCPVKNPNVLIGYESLWISPRTFIKSRIHCFLFVENLSRAKGTNLLWFSRCASLLLLMAVDKFCSDFNGQKPYVEVSWNGGAPKSI